MSERSGVASRLAGLAVDAMALGGAGLVVHGVDQINRPAAFIVAGLFLLAAAWQAARRGA